MVTSPTNIDLLPFGIIIYKEDIQVVGFVNKFYFAPLIIAGSGANHDNYLYQSSVMEGVSAELSCLRILLYLWLFGFI